MEMQLDTLVNLLILLEQRVLQLALALLLPYESSSSRFIPQIEAQLFHISFFRSNSRSGYRSKLKVCTGLAEPSAGMLAAGGLLFETAGASTCASTGWWLL